jgi:hypothetical protein
MTDVSINILKYEIDFFSCNTSQYLGGNAYNSLTFINYGSNAVNIENITLQPNQQLEIAGNVGEITTQRFFVNFVGSTSGNVTILRKRYLNI